MTLVLLVLFGIAVTIIVRLKYRLQAHRRAISVIAEAHATKEIFPGHYPAYHEMAKAIFEKQGIKDLVRYLPLPE